jgi:hypothetical protein
MDPGLTKRILRYLAPEGNIIRASRKATSSGSELDY